MANDISPEAQKLVLDLARSAREFQEWGEHLASVVERAAQALDQFPTGPIEAQAGMPWNAENLRVTLRTALDVIEHARAILKEGMP